MFDNIYDLIYKVRVILAHVHIMWSALRSSGSAFDAPPKTGSIWRGKVYQNKSRTRQHLPLPLPQSISHPTTTRKMATHNIVVFGGDHCGPEVSLKCANGLKEAC